MEQYDEDGDLFQDTYDYSFDEHLHCSPSADNSHFATVNHQELQVPLRDVSPGPESPSRNLDMWNNDSLGSIPLSEPYSTLDPPQLLPMYHLPQGISYSEPPVSEVPYNSFEQPVAVVNGEYSHAVDSPPIHHERRTYYADDHQQPSTSSQTPVQQYPVHLQGSHRSQPTNMQQTHSTPARSGGTMPQRSGSGQTAGHHLKSVHVNPSISQPKQRLQPRPAQSARKKNHVEVIPRANPMTTNTPKNAGAVNLSAQQLQMMICIQSELSTLKEQNEQLGFDDSVNSDRVKELHNQMALLFFDAASSQPQQVNSDVLNTLHQLKEEAVHLTPHPPPRAMKNNRQHRGGPHFDSQPDSPQYKPQMYSSQPSTSQTGNQYLEYASSSISTPHSQNIHQPANVQHRVATQIQHPPQVTHAYQTGSAPNIVYRQVQHPSFTPGSGPTVVQTLRHPNRNGVSKQNHAASQSRQVVNQSHASLGKIAQKPVVYERPTRMSAESTQRRISERRSGRMERLRGVLDEQQESIWHPDTEQPFVDEKDMIFRLLPYHLDYEPDIPSEVIDLFDSNHMRHWINLSDKKSRLERKMRSILFKQAQNSNIDEENNLLSFLDNEYERRKLQQEKEAGTSVDSSSMLQPFGRAVPSSHVKTEAKDHVSLNYEYHSFIEFPHPVSPYKSPSPVKSSNSSVRSCSPMKSPVQLSSSRLRMRPPSISKSSANEVIKIRPPPRPRISPEKRLADVIMSAPKAPSEEQIDEKAITPPVKVFSGLPVKKEFLLRARQDIPPALRSPPAHRSLQFGSCSENLTNGMESDGSCSPELGMDDVIISAAPRPSALTYVRPRSPKASVLIPETVPSAIDKQSATKTSTDAENDAVPSIRKFDSEIIGKADDDSKFQITPEISKSPVVTSPSSPTASVPETLTEHKFGRFKPQVPRPIKLIVPKENAASLEHATVKTKFILPETASTDIFVKQDNVPPPRLAPIKLKINIARSTVVDASNGPEEGSHISRTTHKSDKDKKKKHKKRKRDREESEKRREKRMKDKEVDVQGLTQQKLIIVPPEGKRLKILFNGPKTIQSCVPSISHTVEPGMAVIRSTGNIIKDEICDLNSEKDKPTPAKAPRLTMKIRRLPPPVSLPMVATPSVPQNNGTSVPLVPQVPFPSTQSSLPPVEFSDDSDSETERLRSSSDEPLRGCGLKLHSLTSQVLPWSSKP